MCIIAWTELMYSFSYCSWEERIKIELGPRINFSQGIHYYCIVNVTLIFLRLNCIGQIIRGQVMINFV